MLVALTAQYAGVLALISVVLAINVAFHRFKYRVMPGDGSQPHMRRMARIHSNTIESIPLCVLLMALYELNGGAKMVLHVAGITLILGRVLYAGSLRRHEEPSSIRVIGVTATWLTSIVLAVLNIWHAAQW